MSNQTTESVLSEPKTAPSSEPIEVLCDNLDIALQEHQALGYRLDMIFPADSPREALISKPADDGGGDRRTYLRLKLSQPPDSQADKSACSGWNEGRAGMGYRDLIPGRVGGKAIASHIRLVSAGEVSDYVHFHKIDFQMIYCLKGRIKVVYEDQGPPFWLETGDCVVQPPEIRHRVLEATAGAEVLEVTMPAEHETWVDHEMELPNDRVDPDRQFRGQRFVHTRAPAL